MREYKESGGGSSGSSKKYSKYSLLCPVPHFEWTFYLITIILFQNMILALSNWLFLTISPHFIPEGRGRRKEGRMKKRGKGSQVVEGKKRRSELQATTALRVESSYPVRRAHQSQTKAKDGSAR